MKNISICQSILNINLSKFKKHTHINICPIVINDYKIYMTLGKILNIVRRGIKYITIGRKYG